MNCKFCNSIYTYYDTTVPASKDKANILINNTSQTLVLEGSDNDLHEMKIKYCPVCGRNLDTIPVRNTEHDYSITIRENIKSEMEANHVTICKLSSDTGISKSTISDFLLGKIKSISCGKIGVIADSLRIPVERLYHPAAHGLGFEESLIRGIIEDRSTTHRLTGESPFEEGVCERRQKEESSGDVLQQDIPQSTPQESTERKIVPRDENLERKTCYPERKICHTARGVAPV